MLGIIAIFFFYILYSFNLFIQLIFPAHIASRTLCSYNDKTRPNGRVIMSHIIKDDGLIAQRRLMCMLVFFLSLIFALHSVSFHSLYHFAHRWIVCSAFTALSLVPQAKKKNLIIWCQQVQTISEVSLSTEIRQQVIPCTNQYHFIHLFRLRSFAVADYFIPSFGWACILGWSVAGVKWLSNNQTAVCFTREQSVPCERERSIFKKKKLLTQHHDYTICSNGCLDYVIVNISINKRQRETLWFFLATVQSDSSFLFFVALRFDHFSKKSVFLVSFGK